MKRREKKEWMEQIEGISHGRGMKNTRKYMRENVNVNCRTIYKSGFSIINCTDEYASFDKNSKASLHDSLSICHFEF